MVGDYWIEDLCCCALGTCCLVWATGMAEEKEAGKDRCCC